MNGLWLGGAVGLVTGVGIAMIFTSIPICRRPRLDHRLSPYLRDAPRPSRLLTPACEDSTSVVTVIRRVSGPVLADVIRLSDRLIGGQRSIHRRLSAMNSAKSVEDFRLEQLAWGIIGALGGSLIILVLFFFLHATSSVTAVCLVLGGLVMGILSRDWWLSISLHRRERVMLAEFPVIAELLALAVVAGESAASALERVCRLTGGEIAHDLSGVLARFKAGTPLVRALEELRDRTSLEVFVRFLDGMIVALERGTPLADVMRAQADDAREASKRALVESGGRREIAMLFPVVFGVLPVTVVFALYPGLITLVQLTH